MPLIWTESDLPDSSAPLGPFDGTEEPSSQPNLEALHAFRTIITMLSLIQSEKRIPDKQRKRGSQELKIVDALAAIIIRDHGVAAVAANPGSGQIEVFTSVSSLVAQNPRKLKKKNPEESLTDPFIVNPTSTIPKHLKGITKPSVLLKAFLTQDWHKPDTETFGTHIWMLSKLLGCRDDPLSFLYYVIAACYKKLILQMTHLVSNNYRIALENVPTFECYGGLFPEPSPNELEHDRLFLCEHLPEVKTHLGIEIPNLLRQVDSRDFYTRETCNEFHLLLCRLLTLFLDALYELGKLREPVANLDKIYKQLDLITLFGLTLKSMIGGATMKKHLLNITEFLPDGTALGKQTEVVHDRRREEADEEAADEEFHTFQLDARSPKACHDWLELMVLHFDATQRLADYIKKTKGPEVVIRIVSQTPPDRYMLPWKVMLKNEAYFPDNDPSFPVEDIISFLTPVANSTFVRRCFNFIERVLLSVIPSEWYRIIAESFLTPVTTSSTSFLDSHLDSTSNPTTSIADATPQISAEALVQQLKEIGKIPKVVNTDGHQVWNLEAFNEAIEPIIETVKNLKLTNCISVGWEEYANRIAQRLVALQNTWTLSDEGTTMEDISKIIKMIDTMKDNAMIYWALRPNSSLDTGVGFIGNFHAEAILATFLCRQKTGTAILGVSKWCCPVCAFLLPKLDKDRKPFIFTNQHHTITSCALPHALPEDVILLMIQEFGGQLRKALSELRVRTDLLRHCDSSIGSGHLSDSGSVHSHVKIR